MEIRDIKQQLRIITVAAHYGCTPTRNNLIRCPFHDDKTASLQLYPKTNTWHCFGCGKGTDAIDFIQLKENCSTHEAILKAEFMLSGAEATFLNHQLNHKEIMETKTEQIMQPMNTIPTNPLTVQQSSPLTQEQRIATLTQAFSYFARSMQSRDEKPKEYLKKRALEINKITVGYDGHNFHKGIDEALREHYLATGLLYPDKLGRAGNYHSFFAHCIVFPILNEKGEIVNLYGRCIDDTKESKHRYLPGKHQGIYPKYPKPETEFLII